MLISKKLLTHIMSTTEGGVLFLVQIPQNLVLYCLVCMMYHELVGKLEPKHGYNIGAG